MLSRRSVIAALGAGVAAGPLRADELYPDHAVTLVVPFPPGGSTDVIARIVAEGLSGMLGQPVIVDNHGGAGGSVGTAVIARAKPDGYIIGMGTASTLAINPAAYAHLPYDVATDLVPIGAIADVPNIMSITPGLPVYDMAEFIAYAKAGPGKVAYGSSGLGSVSHLMGEQFMQMTGTQLLHVPYRGVGPALNDVVAGQIQVMFDNLPTSLPMVQAGKLRALAVSSKARLATLPNVPTFKELTLDDLDWTAFFGLVAPAKTPEAIVLKLNVALNRTLKDQAVRDRLAQQQAMVTADTPAEFAALIKREAARMKRAAAAANIHIE
jgi:tripartite-type tricarboxylate transporter receptor subunit TctC